MTKTRTTLWLAVNAALTLVALYTAFIDAAPKSFPESRGENAVIGIEGIVAWAASFAVWRLRQRGQCHEGLSRSGVSPLLINLLYAAGFAVSLALYALRVIHSDYR